MSHERQIRKATSRVMRKDLFADPDERALYRIRERKEEGCPWKGTFAKESAF